MAPGLTDCLSSPCAPRDGLPAGTALGSESPSWPSQTALLLEVIGVHVWWDPRVLPLPNLPHHWRQNLSATIPPLRARCPSGSRAKAASWDLAAHAIPRGNSHTRQWSWQRKKGV